MITSRKHQNEALAAIKQNTKGVIHLPTGTGKTVIQAMAIADAIQNAKNPGVYVVLAPRIVLANQLMAELFTMLDDQKIEAQYLIVHSGSPEDLDAIKFNANTEIAEVVGTVLIQDIKDDYARAQRRKVPLIICGTYHSADRIQATRLPIDIILNDEAHNIVTMQFEWVADTSWSKRSYFFTATLRVTAGDIGLGMNNEARFGKIIYQKTPAEMIAAGEIVRPRIHLVNATQQVGDDQEDAADVAAVMDSFLEHRAILNTSAKMLVVTRGKDHLNSIITDNRFTSWCRTRPTLKVFDISSEFGARINGEVVDRIYFLSQLKEAGRNPGQEMIIFHIDILTEGIDVPGITGVLMFDAMTMIKFIQTVGRASRLDSTDRAQLYDGKIKADELKKFVKPYAYVIVPVYGFNGNDRHATIREMVAGLRDYNFHPQEDVIVRVTNGKFVPDPIGTVNTPDEAHRQLVEYAGDLVHSLEDEMQANQLMQMAARIHTPADLGNLLYSMS